MSLNSEDKKDITKAYGKALANKVSKATKDGNRYEKVHKYAVKDTHTGQKMSTGNPAEDGYKAGRQDNIARYNKEVRKQPVKLGPNGRPMTRK